jgi:hypothetical protein
MSFEHKDSQAKVGAARYIQSTNEVINEVILLSGAVVTFDENGGKIDPQQKTISGVAVDGTESGTPVTIHFDDIYALQLK